MRGLPQHLWLSLRLNFRSPQALIYGYLVPIFFLLAFGSVFRSSVPPLAREMGQLLTITVLGGACFGMPTAMVAERERGVWRRYRLLPAESGGLVLSAMVARYVIVLLGAVMQIVLAWCIYRTPFPARLGELLISFTCVCFAFLGMGLIIAMAADTVPAVQALGQAVFLPMIMIGGVGVPLRALPPWAWHVAAFLPGRYAVEALDACLLPSGTGLRGSAFATIALMAIGLTALLAGCRMFRWDVNEKLAGSTRIWIAVALVGWAAVGFAAEWTGHLTVPIDQKERAHSLLEPSLPAPAIVRKEPWEALTAADLNAITYEDVLPDEGVVTPVMTNLDPLEDAERDRLDTFEEKLANWPPAKEIDRVQRVRNLLSACAVPDALEDPLEGAVPIVIFQKLRSSIPEDDLKKILGWIITHPSGGSVLLKIPELGVEGEMFEQRVRERSTLYAKKLLYRLLGKTEHNYGR